MNAFVLGRPECNFCVHTDAPGPKVQLGQLKHPKSQLLAVGVLPVCVRISWCQNLTVEGINLSAAWGFYLVPVRKINALFRHFCNNRGKSSVWTDLYPDLFLCIFWWHLPVCSWLRCTARTVTADRCGFLQELRLERCVTCWSRRLTAAIRKTGRSSRSIPVWAWVRTPAFTCIYSPETTRHVFQPAYMSSTERCLEDHEVVLEVQASWSLKSDTRFVFCKNYAKYEFFRKPMVSSLQRVC